MIICCLWILISSNDAFHPTALLFRHRQEQQSMSTRPAVLQMGLLGDMASLFLKDRHGDFVRLQDSEDIGTSAVLLLYKITGGIGLDEIQDMLEDGAPVASRQGIALQVISSKDSLLELTLEEALKQVSENYSSSSSWSSSSSIADIKYSPSSSGCPVLLFSGFSNPEMMASYKILAEEIYKENGSRAACAKAVPNALNKPMSQVLEEISGDHQEAISEDLSDKK
jgi:hypothetical protein